MNKIRCSQRSLQNGLCFECGHSQPNNIYKYKYKLRYFSLQCLIPFRAETCIYIYIFPIAYFHRETGLHTVLNSIHLYLESRKPSPRRAWLSFTPRTPFVLVKWNFNNLVYRPLCSFIPVFRSGPALTQLPLIKIICTGTSITVNQSRIFPRTVKTHWRSHSQI